MKYSRIIIFILSILLMILILSELEALFKINFHQYFNPELYSNITHNMHINNKKIQPNINKGRKIAQNKKIVICALARNISSVFNKTYKKLEFIGKQFNNYKIVIFENDSSDNSRSLIRGWTTRNNNVILLDCCHMNSCNCHLKKKEGYSLGQLSQKRISNMAMYREVYLDYVKKNYNHYDYMLVMDFDLDGNTNIEGLFYNLSYPGWDAIFINGQVSIPGTFGQILAPYDAMAYVSIKDDYEHNISLFKLIRNYIEMKYYTHNNKMMPVKSAFNGYGLYKIKSIMNTSYLGNLQCEHLNLAQDMINNKKKLFINPGWIGYFNKQGPDGGFIKIVYGIIKTNIKEKYLN